MRVFTIIGPSQSGKASLLDAMAGLDGPGATRTTVGGVATAVSFRFMDEAWTGIAVTGGAETLSQAGAAIAASDAVVLCLPPEADAAVLSAPHLRLIEEAGLPSFIFINRIETATDRLSAIVAALQVYSAHGIVLRQVPIREDGQVTGAVDLISERAWHYEEGRPSTLVELPPQMLGREKEARTELLESLSDFDDALLEQLVEDRQPATGDLYHIATRALQHHDLIPAFLGSAEQCHGVFRLMKSLRHEAPGCTGAADRIPGALAAGLLVDQVKHLGKTVLVRALQAGVASGRQLGGGNLGALTALDGKTQVPELAPGAVALAVKSDHLNAGAAWSDAATLPLPGWSIARDGAHRRLLMATSDRDETRLSSALSRMAEIDPGLRIMTDDQTGHAILLTQGPLHLRRVIQKLAEVFGVEARVEPVPAALRETVTRKVEHAYRHKKQSGGAGQFADVQIDLEPEARGAGFRFAEIVKGGAVPRNYIPAVEAGAREALESGPAGYPVIDVAVTLKDGKHHAVDSSDFAFRTAGKAAVREALAAAGPILLQPIMKVDIQVPSVFSGALVPLVSGLRGQVLGFEGHPGAAGWDMFHALSPMGMLDELFNGLAAATRGTGWYSAEFDHYQETRAEELTGA